MIIIISIISSIYLFLTLYESFTLQQIGMVALVKV